MSDLVAGVDFSGASKTPADIQKNAWIATGRLTGWQYQVVDVKQIGSHALAAELNRSEFKYAGIDCPFSLPRDFLDFLAQKALRPNFQSWQDVAEHLVFMPFEDFQHLVIEFKKEPKRITDKTTLVAAPSPLHRGNPPMVQMTYQIMRMLATLEPKKFSVLPFQEMTASRCTLLEVYPRDFLRTFNLPDSGYKATELALKVRRQIIAGMNELRERKTISTKNIIRISLPKVMESTVLNSDRALDAVIASYITAIFATAPQMFTDPFATDEPDVLLEGWTYTLKQLS